MHSHPNKKLKSSSSFSNPASKLSTFPSKWSQIMESVEVPKLPNGLQKTGTKYPKRDKSRKSSNNIIDSLLNSCLLNQLTKISSIEPLHSPKGISKLSLLVICKIFSISSLRSTKVTRCLKSKKRQKGKKIHSN